MRPAALALFAGCIASQQAACSTRIDVPAAGGAEAPGGGAGGVPAASSAAGSACVPGSIDACYTGPQGTQDVGVCVAGVKMCDPAGTAYGPCTSEVTPAADLCATAADEDCSGSSTGCVASPTWTRGYHAPEAAPLEIAVDSLGSVVVVGMLMGTVDFGGGPISSAAEDDELFVLKLDRDGNHLWSKHFAGSQLWPQGLAIDGGDNVLITGTFSGAADLGAGKLSTANEFLLEDSDVFVVKLDTNGVTSWSKRFGGDGGDGAGSIAADPPGNVFVLGTFLDAIDLGCGSLGDGDSGRSFLAKLDPGGNCAWSKDLGAGIASPASLGSSLGADASGNVIVALGASYPVDFGGGAIAAGSDGDVVVAKLDPGGEQLWAERFGDGASQSVDAAIVDAGGSVVLAGSFAGSIDFGGGALSTSGAGTYLAKLDPAGAHVWSRNLTQGVASPRLAVMGAGNAVLGGELVGPIDLGSGLLAPNGAADPLVAKLDASGTPLAVKQLGQAEAFSAFAVDASGSVFVTGSFDGTIDFGDGPLPAAPGEWNMFVARLTL